MQSLTSRVFLALDACRAFNRLSMNIKVAGWHGMLSGSTLFPNEKDVPPFEAQINGGASQSRASCRGQTANRQPWVRDIPRNSQLCDEYYFVLWSSVCSTPSW
jgi:hypothetical protein